MDIISHRVLMFISIKRNLLILLILPVMSIVSIYLYYGNIIDKYFIEHQALNKLYQLKLHLEFFNSNFAVVPLEPISQIAYKIGYVAVALIYLMFFIWLILTCFSTYFKLSNRIGSKLLMLSELILILGLYMLVIVPGLNFIIKITGFLLIAFILTIILMYWFLVKNDEQ